MNCKFCGEKNNIDATSCNSCGNILEYTKKESIKDFIIHNKKLILISFICVILIPVLVWGIFNNNSQKSDRELYKELELNYLESHFNQNKSSIIKIYEKEIKPYIKNSSNIKSQFNITDFILPKSILGDWDITLPLVGRISGYIYKLSFKLDTTLDLNQNKKRSDIETMFSGRKILNLEYFDNGEIYGIKIPNIYDKFLIFDTKNIEKFREKNDIDLSFLSEELLSIDELSSLLNLYDLNFNLFERYFLLAFDSIPEENFTLEKNEIVGNTKIKADKYTILIHSTICKEIVVRGLEGLRDDIELYKSWVSKVQKISAYVGLLYEIKSDVGQINLIKKIDELIIKVNNMGENEFPNITLEAWIDKDKKVISRDIYFDKFREKTGRYTSLETIVGTTQSLLINNTDTGLNIISVKNSYKRRSENKNSYGNIQYDINYYKNIKGDLGYRVDTTKENETFVNLNVENNVFDSNLTYTFDNNKKLQQREDRLVFKLELGKTDEDYIKIGVVSENQYKVGGEVRIPEINKDTSEDISIKSKEEIVELVSKIRENIMQWVKEYIITNIL